ncbi:response regulator [Odoribacter laneus]|uniref:response regulator n=1 Tax=Odoribacter laneus TaxID=626933 RepID=UPI003AF909E6
MKKPSRHTKLKVVSGYILLFILTIAAITFIYKQISRFTDNDQLVSTANQKLFIIGNTITGLYEAESLSSSFIQTGSPSSFRKYIQIIKQVELNIDSLKNMTDQPEQIARIDTIHTLLNSKIKNLKELIRAKKSQNPEDYYNQAIALIESNRDTSPDIPQIQKRVITTRDSSYIKSTKKKKGFLGIFSSRQPDSSLQITVTNQEVWDTLYRPTPATNADSIMNILKSAWENFQAETENLNRQITQKEYNIVLQSVRITEQLKKVLYDYENEEINTSISRMKQREEVMNSAAAMIAKIAIIAVLFIAFFCTLILKDITRNQRYRQELEKAKTYTDQLLKSREQLMLSVTHDIKSPLSSVLGYIELLNTTHTDERQRYFLKNMQSSSEHIQKLVMNLLDFSKLENNKVKPENVSFNPARLFQEINDSFIPLAKTKNLVLNFHIDDKLDKEYTGDALRIRQIIVNLMSNAIKYTEKGSVALIVTTNIPGDKLIIQVKDTGPGLSKEEQTLIFQEFTRLTSSVPAEGTGLGLTITQKLVHLLKGQILLDSKPGKGSCFTIELPLKKSAAHPSASEAGTPSPSVLTTTVDLSRLKILLVDDDPLQLEMAASLLKNQGIQSFITTHPQEIINKLQAEHYDLVFSDIQMPEMNGFELVKQIRKQYPSLPVVALSADSDKKEEDYLQAGFTTYLSKPFSSRQLMQLILRLTGQESSTLNLSSSPEEKNLLDEENRGYTLKNILQFTDNDPKALQKILISFTSSTQEHIELLKKYLQEKQWKAIGLLAHKMLPLFRQLEVKEVITSLQQLEHSDKNPLSEKQSEERVRQVIDLSEKLIRALQNQMDNNL